MTGITTDVAIIWFLEKIPMQAPAMIEITNPIAMTGRKKSLSSDGKPVDITAAPIMQIVQMYVTT